MTAGSRRGFFRDIAAALIPATEQPTDGLSDQERERYARQLELLGPGGQIDLLEANVLVVGAGALGAPAALYLAAAGVGQIGIADDAEVASSDLARQLLHYTPDVGVAKTDSAVAKLRFLAPDALIEPFRMRVDADNAAGLIAHDLVLDCSGDDATHRVLDRVCEEAGVPLVLGGARGFGGWVLSVRPGASKGYRELFAEPQADRAGAPLLGPAAGVIGSLMAFEAIALLTGVAEPQLDRPRRVELSSGG